jgi:hypothetical protein
VVKEIPVMNGWIIFRPSSAPMTIDEFVEKYDPTALSMNQHLCAWICAESPSKSLIPKEEPSDVDGLVTAWHDLPDSSKTKENLGLLSKVYNVLVGKWMAFCSPDVAKAKWSIIAKDVVSGNLGPSAKISTSSDPKKQHVICIYTNDYIDEEDVNRVRVRLNELGFKGKLQYKPDSYTYCDIYANNPWNILPSCYTK